MTNGEEKTGEPETNTEGDVSPLELKGEPASGTGIPVAPPIVAAAPAPAPAAPAGPRVFPQHYTLLFGTLAVALGSLLVWERAAVCGVDVAGTQMIRGSILLLLGTYSAIVAILNILQGRLRVGSAALTGLLALYFTIEHIVKRITKAPAFKKFGDFEGALQTRIEKFIGQFGPGELLVMLGGAVIMLIFLKAFLPGKSSAEAPAPTSRRPRR